MIPTLIDKSRIPHKSGVYIFRDRKGEVIYVGKAIDLYHRVASYFLGSDPKGWTLRTKTLVGLVASVETIVVESELEALILEANLIKGYLPKFNIRLTDDKDYLYIKITKEGFPKVVTARKHDLKRALKYFGPFPSSKTVRDTLKSLRKVFPWCTSIKYHRACFYYQLGLCPGPCAGNISQKDYRKIINRFIKFLEGKKDDLVDQLTKEMTQASTMQNFEEAGRLKKMIAGVNYLTQSQRVEKYLENPNFLEDQNKIALQVLQKALNLPQIPNRIEGYDISNILGKEATGSMVVLTNGEIDKSQYRKFKIHISGKPNDVAMMSEMISRRVKHQDWARPNLVIIDGGKGQVNAVWRELKDIPVLGLAKRMEWLYTSDGSVIKLTRSSPALHLLQKLRDEAHRFALSYHRKLRDKKMLSYYL